MAVTVSDPAPDDGGHREHDVECVHNPLQLRGVARQRCGDGRKCHGAAGDRHWYDEDREENTEERRGSQGLRPAATSVVHWCTVRVVQEPMA